MNGNGHEDVTGQVQDARSRPIKLGFVETTFDITADGRLDLTQTHRDILDGLASELPPELRVLDFTQGESDINGTPTGGTWTKLVVGTGNREAAWKRILSRDPGTVTYRLEHLFPTERWRDPDTSQRGRLKGVGSGWEELIYNVALDLHRADFEAERLVETDRDMAETLNDLDDIRALLGQLHHKLEDLDARADASSTDAANRVRDLVAATHAPLRSLTEQAMHVHTQAAAARSRYDVMDHVLVNLGQVAASIRELREQIRTAHDIADAALSR